MLCDRSRRKTEAFGSDTARSLHNKERNQSSVFSNVFFSGSGVICTVKHVLTSYPLGLRKGESTNLHRITYIYKFCVYK